MTEQQLWDATVQAYVMDKEPFGFDRANDECQYRSHDGARCAIGRHIPDALYDSGMEGHSVIHLKGDYGSTFNTVFGGLNSSFALSVQDAHDTAATKLAVSLTENARGNAMQAFTRELELLAAKWNLDGSLLEDFLGSK